MHDSLGVHLLQTRKEAEHELFDLIWSEVSIVLLDFVEKLSSSEQFQNNVDWIIGLVDSL